MSIAFERLKPFGPRVLVKRIQGEEKTSGGIIIPDASKDKTQTGMVLAVGAGKKDTQGNVVPLDVKVGDHVYFGKYAGAEAGNDHLIINEDDILGIVEK